MREVELELELRKTKQKINRDKLSNLLKEKLQHKKKPGLVCKDDKRFILIEVHLCFNNKLEPMDCPEE